MILDLFKLTGRVALVTGASRGLGQAMAIGLAEAGADIACVSSGGNDADTRKQVESLGRRFLGVKADLSEPGQRVGLVDKVVVGLGGIDILVNNAGIALMAPLADFKLADFDKTFAINVRAVFVAAQRQRFGGSWIESG